MVISVCPLSLGTIPLHSHPGLVDAWQNGCKAVDPKACTSSFEHWDPKFGLSPNRMFFDP